MELPSVGSRFARLRFRGREPALGRRLLRANGGRWGQSDCLLGHVADMMRAMEGAFPVMRVRVAVVFVAVAALLAAGLGTAVLLDSGRQPARQAAGPVVGSYSGDGPSYSSLRQLVGNSDLIVVGTVEDTSVGKVYGDDPTGEFPTRDLHTVVAVDEVLKGASSTREVTVITNELAFSAPNLEDWRQAGTRVVIFLTPSREQQTAGFHILANINYAQTAYFVRGEDVEAAIVDPLSKKIAALSLSELRESVRQQP